MLSKNEKVEQHIRKKTHKLITLKILVKGDVMVFYMGWLMAH